MKPEVVIVVDYAHISGGAEKVGIVSARGLADRGYRVTVFAVAGPVDPNLLREPKVDVVTVYERYAYHELGRIKRRTQGAWNKEAQAAFARLLERKSADETIVHFHSFRDQLTASVFEPLLHTPYRVVMTIHDYGLACPMGGFYDYRLHAACKLVGGSGACARRNCILARPEFKWWYFWKFTKMIRRAQVRRRVNRFLFVSEFARRHLTSYLPETTPQEILDNPIEIERRPLRSFPASAPFTYLGRLTEEKDPVTFARAARLAEVQAVFVGSGPLEAAVRDANPSAEITGWVAPAEVGERLGHARALVFPSRWYEAQPLVILESLATGVPCLVSDASAAREMVRDGVDGLVFRAGDVEQCADLLRRLSDDACAAEMGKAAYDRYWADPLTLERHLDRLEQVYEEMLA